MTSRLTFIHALSRLHPGVGQGPGVIDLPIAREKATGIPYLPGTSLKGALRSRCMSNGDSDACNRIFGAADELHADNNRASAVQFSDQRLLLLPIRSLAGTFAWVTSPYILHRLLRDIEDVQMAPPTTTIPTFNIPRADALRRCYIAVPFEKSAIIAGTSEIYLEDLDLIAESREDDVRDWASWIGKKIFSDENDKAWQDMFIQRFCLIHDDVFNFLLETATEVNARIKLQEGTKTVESGGLWYEEALPAETILSGIALATPVKDTQTKSITLTPEEIFAKLDDYTATSIQLGGNATVGQGMCRVRMVEREKAGKQYASRR
jgi:CRISPR-associated protein Cmr4